MKQNVQRAALMFFVALGFVFTGVTSTAQAQTADNILINGDFDSGELAPWTNFQAENVNASFNIVDGEVAVTGISGAGGAVWHIQLNQALSQAQRDLLTVGQAYKVSFDARSNVDGRLLRMFFGEDGGTFAQQGEDNVTLSTTMQTFEVTFTLTAKYDAMKLGFEMGLSNDDVYIDNVVLTETEAVASGLDLPVTFEDADLNYALADFGGNFSEIITDPTDSGNLVVSSTKGTSGVPSEGWAGATVGEPSGFATPIPFSSGNTTMSVRVWSPVADIPVRLKVENSNDNTMTVETEARTTVAGEWETLVFNFASQASGTAALNFASTYNKASIFFDFNTPGTGQTYYWDDMVFGGEGSATGPAAPEGFAADGAPAAVPMNPGDIFLAVGPNNVGQGGIEYRLFYAPEADNVEDPLTATEYSFGTTAGDGGGVAAFGFVLGGREPATSYTFWLYQYDTNAEEYSAPAAVTATTAGDGDGGDNGGGDGGDDTNTLDLPVTFEDTEQDYKLADFGGAASEIVEDPTNSANRVVRTVKGTDAAPSEGWAGTTVGEDDEGPDGFANAIPFDQQNTTMSLRVWSPTADIPVRLKVENSDDPTVTVETEARTTVAGEWETLTFDFANQAAGTAALNLASRYNKASVFCDFDTPGTGETYYWDDMTFGGEAAVTAPGAPIGFQASNTIGETPVGAGEAFLAAGPNNAEQADIEYRLFYAKTSDGLENPLEGTEYEFGTTAGDGDGNAAFGFVIASLDPATEYNFWLYQYNTATELFSEPALATVVSGGEGTSVDDLTGMPVEFALSQNFPNPFNPTTSIRFDLPESGQVQLEVFNMMGQRVATLVNETRAAGSHSVTFDASALSSGMYLYRLQAGNNTMMKKMTLIK